MSEQVIKMHKQLLPKAPLPTNSILASLQMDKNGQSTSFNSSISDMIHILSNVEQEASDLLMENLQLSLPRGVLATPHGLEGSSNISDESNAASNNNTNNEANGNVGDATAGSISQAADANAAESSDSSGPVNATSKPTKENQNMMSIAGMLGQGPLAPVSFIVNVPSAG